MLHQFWLSIERGILFHLIRLFRIRGQSERVARGFAVGLVVNFLPTFGFGVLVSGFAARMVGGNAVAGLAGGALRSRASAAVSPAAPLMVSFRPRTFANRHRIVIEIGALFIKVTAPDG